MKILNTEFNQVCTVSFGAGTREQKVIDLTARTVKEMGNSLPNASKSSAVPVHNKKLSNPLKTLVKILSKMFSDPLV